MSEIVLASINAKYVHPSLGLRYLYANLGTLQEKATILEFTRDTSSEEIAEKILSKSPRIVGFGVYIWNLNQTLEVIQLLRRRINDQKADLTIIVGGPEVSHHNEQSEIIALSDFLIKGEADLAFRELCLQIVAGQKPAQKIVVPAAPLLTELVLPYSHYSDSDLRHRLTYVEASRGCPFTCEFCLSSLKQQGDHGVRKFELDAFLKELALLIQRGARRLKFVDRTFNIDLKTATRVLDFIRPFADQGVFAHFEMIPDRFPEELRVRAKDFPAGALQFEVGLQTLNPEVAERISRRQDYSKTLENLRFLRQETQVHLHADLIVGLPGESIESFAQGFDQLYELGPHEIQVGILKRLKGTPIARHDIPYGMRYSETPPYEIIENTLISEPEMLRLKRFARYWEIFVNQGRFPTEIPALLSKGKPFSRFLEFSDWVYASSGKTYGFSLEDRRELLRKFTA
ncbi:DUF4080 domain-containing protein [Bdellovibrionota bacterium FG-2]